MKQRVEALGATPLADDLAAIDALTSLGDFARLLGQLERTGIGGLIGAAVNTDDRKSDRYVVNFFQGGIGLPDESYYREETHAETRAKYVAHLTTMFGLLGDSETDAADAARRVMELETRLASGHWDNVASRDVVKTYNLMTRDELVAAAPGFDWAAWEQGMQAPEHRVERGRRTAAELSHDSQRGIGRRAARRLEAVVALPDRVSCCALPEQRFRRRELRLLPAYADRRAGDEAALEAGGVR